MAPPPASPPPPRPPPRGSMDAEDRRFLGLLSLSASLVLGAAGWALSQESVEAAVLAPVPERILTVLVAPPSPPGAPAAPPPGAVGAPPGAPVPSGAPAAAPEPLGLLAAAMRRQGEEGTATDDDALRAALDAIDPGTARDRATWDERDALLRRMAAAGRGPLPDVPVGGRGPVPTLGGAETSVDRVWSVQAAGLAPAQGALDAALRLPPEAPTLQPATVSALARDGRRDFERCIAVGRRADPTLSGRVALVVEGAGGRVRRIALAEGPGSVGEAALVRCLQSMSRRWTLPPDAAGAGPLVVVVAP